MGEKKITRTFEMSIEKSERVLIRSRLTVFRQCIVCENEGDFVTASEAARRTGVNQREIFRSVESGKIGFAELAEGSLLICLGCLELPNLS